MARVLLAIAVSFGLLASTPSPSWACSCAVASTAQQTKAAGTVAAGIVDWTATDGQTRTYEVDFDAVYKGAAATSEKLTTAASEAACGAGALATGKRYLFFIDGEHPGSMRLTLCGGTAAYDEAVARQVEAVTGPPGQPTSAPHVDQVTGNERGRTISWAVGGAAALLVVGGAAFALRRRG